MKDCAHPRVVCKIPQYVSNPTKQIGCRAARELRPYAGPPPLSASDRLTKQSSDQRLGAGLESDESPAQNEEWPNLVSPFLQVIIIAQA